MRTTFILVCVLISAVNNAQSWQWAQNWGSNLKEFGEYIGQDAAGNLYVKGTLTKYTGQSGGFINYNMVYKFTSAGTFLWCDTLPLTTAMVADPQGNFYTAGGNQVAKYDSAGQQQWIVSYPNYYHLFNLCMHPQGGVVVQGCQSLSSVFLRLDSLGNELWQRTNDCPLSQATPVRCDNYGNAFILYGNNSTPGWIFKINNTGVLTTTLQVPAKSHYLCLASDSSYYVSGFSSAASNSVFTSYLSKHDYNGNLLWMQYVTGSYLNERNIECDLNNNVYITGSYLQDIQFSNYSVNTTGVETFVAKLDPQGNILWLKSSMGGASSVEPRDMIVNTNVYPAEIYLTGLFDGQHFFDTYTLNIGGGGYSDIFLGKIVQSLNVGEQENSVNRENNFSVYPSPTRGIFTLEGNTVGTGPLAVKIMNGLGQVIYKENQKSNDSNYSKVFDLSSLPKGIYFVEVKTNEDRYVKKVVLE